jgi:hypothetical protein
LKIEYHFAPAIFFELLDKFWPLKRDGDFLLD